MKRDITEHLREWIAAGGGRVGQVAVRATPEGWELRHEDDSERGDLSLSVRWQEARQLAALDDAGAFRPLKTQRNLRHGWRMLLPDAESARRALDYFYPSMLGVWRAHTLRELVPVPLPTTLERQTGMYAATKKLTAPEAEAVVAGLCSGCLKRRLWGIAAPDDSPVEASATLLCHEACNLFVAEARKVVKARPA